MKVRRQIVKAVRSCDDDRDDDEAPYYETGSTYEEGGPVVPRRLRSVSPAAHAAIHHRPARSIGFHKPRTDP